MIKVAVVARYLLEREGLVRLLARSPQYHVMAVALSGAELAGALNGRKPDVMVVVADDSSSAARDRSRQLPELDAETPLVVLALRPDAELAANLLAHSRAGRGYFIHKRQDRQRLLDSIQKVASGETVLAPLVIDALIADRRDDEEPSRLQRLTPRELEVLAAIANGLSNESIARSQQITTGAVERHVGAIYGKLELRDVDGVDRRVTATLLYLKDAALRTA